MNPILFFARDPGGANCIIPVVERFLSKGNYPVVLWGKDYACVRYAQHNLVHSDFSNLTGGVVHEQVVRDFVRGLTPRCIVTGTSEDDPTEKWLWRLAREQAVPALAILDYWNSYRLRFSQALSSIDNREQGINCLPDKICVMDDFAKEEMTGEGIPPEVIKVTGQPYLALVKEKMLLSQTKARHYRPILGVPDHNRLIVFVSEAIQSMYRGKGRDHWGYDEVSLLKEIFGALEILCRQTPHMKYDLVIRLHPKDEESIFDEFMAALKPGAVRVTKERGAPVEDLIQAADLVVGASSMVLLETALAGKPFLSVQCGQRQNDPFVLSRMGKVQRVLRKEDLVKRLAGFFLEGRCERVDFPYLENAVENIEKEILSLMEANHGKVSN